MTTRLRSFILAGLAGSAVLCLALSPQDGGGAAAPAVGDKAPTFTAKTIDGKDVKFPGDYKGKLVLVDFWATWCPPCRAEVPHLVAEYQKHHEKGLEMLSVSLDSGRGISVEKVSAYNKQNKMAWPQVYEGAESIATQYAVESIPTPYLVDGDTGKVLAAGEELRNDALGETLSKHMKSLKKSEKGDKADKGGKSDKDGKPGSPGEKPAKPKP